MNSFSAGIYNTCLLISLLRLNTTGVSFQLATMARETPCVDALHGRDTYDVVVVGGGAAGIGAAIGARQANPSAHILLVESESCLGGAATHRTVVSYCGLFTIETCPRKAVAGVWDDIFGRLRKLGGTREKPDRHRGIFQVRLDGSVSCTLDY